MPDDWTPDKPLDKDDEEEVQREAKARSRLNYLVSDYGAKAGVPDEKKNKKKKRLFGNRD
jgi:hypothetical protein